MRKMVCNTFGIAMKELRQYAKISQEACAEYAGVDRSYVSKLESGKQLPSLATLISIGRALGISAERIVIRMEEINPEINAVYTSLGKKLVYNVKSTTES